MASTNRFDSKTDSVPDTVDGWLGRPADAFKQYIKSEHFKNSNRSSRKPPANQAMRDASVDMYLTMFNRYLRFLKQFNCTLIEPTPKAIAMFFEGELHSLAKATFGRYLRLLERIYDHLLEIGAPKPNLVTAWVQERIRLGERPDAHVHVGDPPHFVTPAQVCRLQDWLCIRGKRALEAGIWHEARDLTLASLSLGSGMRYLELALLKQSLVKYLPNVPEGDRFTFDIDRLNTVGTGREHRTIALVDCVALFEAWWLKRWTKDLPQSMFVFPSMRTGQSLNKVPLYRSLCGFADEAVEAKVLDESSRWVLERGVQGLRRAYALTHLLRGRSSVVLSERMGLVHPRSVKRYEDEVRALRPAAPPKPPAYNFELLELNEIPGN